MDPMESARPSNPYSPPESPLKQQAAAPRTRELASRWQRLGGRAVDYLLGALISVPLVLSMGTERMVELMRDQSAMFRIYTDSTAGALTGLAALSFAVLNWYLVITRGQTLGKMLVGTRIVRTDGSPVGFLHGIVLRNWVLLIPSYVAALALAIGAPADGVVWVSAVLSWVVAASYLLVFGSDRRCGHDYLASTKVVQA
jgi:uncharacterized RDD family membrane protein YckC